MELEQIREILSGLRVPVEVRRQAWIEYGGRLAQCPYRQGAQIGAWVREQGLDFVEDGNERSAARKLFNFTSGGEVSLDGCPCATPERIIAWLQDAGQLEVTRREPRETQPEPVEEADADTPEADPAAGVELAWRDLQAAIGRCLKAGIVPQLRPQLINPHHMAGWSAHMHSDGAGLPTPEGYRTLGIAPGLRLALDPVDVVVRDRPDLPGTGLFTEVAA